MVVMTARACLGGTGRESGEEALPENMSGEMRRDQRIGHGAMYSDLRREELISEEKC
jgi:hypothetical protein